ncbi:MAG TPA: OmpA family protein [Allosphingosinicella sp.]|jgi:outer membrane protein OmpA-like peptidoglycan-associated protein
MLNLKFASSRVAALAAMLATLATPAFAQDRFDWGGGRSGERDYRLVGAGVPLLLPELKRTARGRAFVIRNFDRNRDGRVGPREAEDANRAFLLVAGGRRDRFDWESRDVERPVARHREWDRRGMRGYQMRQTRYGATFDLQDVLFETGSARLRPAALERLRPLASYLSANPDVPVRIDGHTDSVGSDSANQLLSERRADAVREALNAMGVEENDFRVAGHGESMPAASNANAAGRQLNRRVEVTLVGQQARSFSE